ncbi:hypothetical protein Q7C36_018583 [Tachysurus vachellii]|uniref:Uncharacterized protein n=1 Tax=Tachysurus vachellii TaxID=175792 RepID=A0AA88M1D0_TACVA|nr:hypothetical protein Q7C36_018583 [Tachysurus vachellii]
MEQGWAAHMALVGVEALRSLAHGPHSHSAVEKGQILSRLCPLLDSIMDAFGDWTTLVSSRLSSCPVYGPGTSINPHCSMLPSTARLPPNNRVHGPLRNSPDAKGHTAGSCYPLSLSSSHLPSPPLCRLLSTYFLTARANRLPLLPPPPPMRSGNLSPRHWRTPPRWPPSAHQRNGFWQP